MSRNTADIEYAVMLAVLNFQSQFMKSCYRQARVDVADDVIHVTLTKSSVVAAEGRSGEAPEGRAMVEGTHTELFQSGEALLRAELERVLGVRISHLASRLDTAAGTNSIIIKLAER